MIQCNRKVSSCGGALLAVLLSFAGVAAADPSDKAIPDSTTITDSIGSSDDSDDMFILEGVDGKRVEETSQEASMRRSVGSNFIGVALAHQVAVGHHRLKVGLVRGYPSPASWIVHSISSKPLEGFIDVDIRGDATYLLDGKVDRFRKEIFLVEHLKGDDAVVGEKVVLKLEDPKWLPSKATASYTCCNLHYDDDTFPEANWTALPFVPAGSRIVVRTRKKDRALIWLDGSEMEIDLEDKDKLATVESVLARVVVPDDPTGKIASYPERVRKAIREGRVFAGMTREQVIVSLGYPRLDTNPSLDAPSWNYGFDEKNPFTLFWAADGTLERIDGAPKAVSRVEYRQ